MLHVLFLSIYFPHKCCQYYNFKKLIKQAEWAQIKKHLICSMHILRRKRSLCFMCGLQWRRVVTREQGQTTHSTHSLLISFCTFVFIVLFFFPHIFVHALTHLNSTAQLLTRLWPHPHVSLTKHRSVFPE